MAWLESIITSINTGVFTYCLWFSLATLLIIVYFEKTRKWNVLAKLPGPKTVPLFGNAIEFNVKPYEILKVVAKLCNPKYSRTLVWIGWTPYCLVYKASSVEVILSSQKHIEKANYYNYLHPWLGTGLLTSGGKKWHSRRKLLTPAFHFKILEDFFYVFNKQSSILVNKLAPKADTGKSFNIFKDVTLCTLDVILGKKGTGVQY